MSKPKADEFKIIKAAQRGDQRARDALVRTCLPVVYNIVGRAMNEHADIDDVVQETMLRVVRDLAALREPESFRAWVAAIAAHQISTHRRTADTAARRTAGLAEIPEPAMDFDELAVLHLRLSGQRREVAQASRWLDDEDQVILSLWWLEAAGEMTRGEVTAALDTTSAYTAVLIQRMRGHLDVSRSVVAALRASHCTELGLITVGWDHRPSSLWRKRIARHVRDCAVCGPTSQDRIATERLLVGCGLVPVPAALAARVTEAIAAHGRPATTGNRVSRAIRGNPVVTTTAAVAVIALTVACAAALPSSSRPVEQTTATRSLPSRIALPALKTSAASTPSTVPTTAAPTPTPAPALSHAGCGTGLADVWANWPMPNPPRTGVPNPESYTNLGNGTVRDNVTCLTWQRTAAPSTYTFTQAKTYCADLSLAGGGWHLPTRIELTSIIDTSRSGPAVDTTAFPGTPAEFFWTSSPWAVTKTPLRAWIVNFYEGLASNAAFQTGAYQVRCVRSANGAGKPEYQISDGQVTDPDTGLTWQRATSSTTMTAAQATTYCAGLNLDGHTWRLPTIQELATTVDETRVAPAINVSAFPDTAHDTWYWSSTIAAPEPAARWALNYDDGFTSFYKLSTGYARCVR